MIRTFLFAVACIVLVSCSTKNDPINPTNLQEFLDVNAALELDEVIACAASDKMNPSNTSYIFYYPVKGATEIQYFETTGTTVNPNDFSLYKPKELPREDVFNGYLERFVKTSEQEVWCIVTYKTEGKFHKSNPIRIKNQTKPTEWISNVSIDFSQSLMPEFSWNDGTIMENIIYFQVISDHNNTLLSGTYTTDKWFQYYQLDNVILNITTTNPPVMIANNDYNFTLMGVSEDNWVNLVIQKPFIAQ